MNLNQSPLVRFHFVLGLVLLLAACADEVTGPDTTPPRAISDLRATYNSQSLIALVWTAPGDDGDDGTASEYDLRISTSPITAKSWGDVERVEFSRTPGTPGTSDFVSIDGLEPESEYYVGIRTADDVPNWSSLSNVPLVKTRTGPDETPPSVIEDLVAVSITEVSITLEWTAPGNDGVEGTSSS